jgi:phosphatidylethanolamine N-methyltransferase
VQYGANQSTTVTNLASVGHWRPIHEEEYDGLIPLKLNTIRDVGAEDDETIEEGEVVFKGETLPWNVGIFEVRVPIN